jgi:hypothetical protein
MNSKSIKVPQPQFCNWVKKSRQELHLSRADLKEKIGNQISDRTLIYLEDDKRDSFSEYTLTLLAKGLDINYLDLLDKINELEKTTIHLSKPVKTKSKVLVFSSIIILFFITFLLIANMNKNGSSFSKIEDVRIHPEYPRVIVGFDKTGKEVWQNNLKTRITKVELYDLDNDGNKEIIAATFRIRPSDEGKSPGFIYIWNNEGKLLAEFNTWKKSIYPAQEPHANIEDFALTDIENDGTPEIVAAVRGYQYHPSRIAVFHFANNSLKEIGTYWNPGYLYQIYIEDVDNDGIKEIICSAVNNHFKNIPEMNIKDNVFSVFMLNGYSIKGQAPPYFGNEENGSEVWYYYVMPDKNNPGSEVTDVTFMGELNINKQIYIKLRDTSFFYLNYNGEIVERYKGDYSTEETELHLAPKQINMAN